jgi:alpha-mannosidase
MKTISEGPNALLSERPREECGIFAVYGHGEAAKLTYFGLYALQHRGQESAGIVVSDGTRVLEHKAMGLVPEIFDERILSALGGHMALGHVRYSTTGSSLLVNAQPFRIQYAGKCLANALSWKREDIVIVEDHGFSSAIDASGRELPCQPLRDGLAVRVSLPSMGATTIALRSAERNAASPFVYDGETLETPHYRLTFDGAGRISSLFDRAAERELVREGLQLNAFYTADDMPTGNDAWDIDRDYRRTVRQEVGMESREIEADGPLLFSLRSRYRIGRRSTLTQLMVFYADSRRIDFETEVDWRERHTLLKVGFGLDIHADSWRNEIQFGHITRSTHTNTSWDQARFEVCAHKWVDLSEGDYGVALLNDCKYGHDALDRMVSLTLLKSATGPDENADQGPHAFTYALFPTRATSRWKPSCGRAMP